MIPGFFGLQKVRDIQLIYSIGNVFSLVRSLARNRNFYLVGVTPKIWGCSCKTSSCTQQSIIWSKDTRFELVIIRAPFSCPVGAHEYEEGAAISCDHFFLTECFLFSILNPTFRFYRRSRLCP